MVLTSMGECGHALWPLCRDHCAGKREGGGGGEGCDHQLLALVDPVLSASTIIIQALPCNSSCYYNEIATKK